MRQRKRHSPELWGSNPSVGDFSERSPQLLLSTVRPSQRMLQQTLLCVFSGRRGLLSVKQDAEKNEIRSARG